MTAVLDFVLSCVFQNAAVRTTGSEYCWSIYSQGNGQNRYRGAVYQIGHICHKCRYSVAREQNKEHKQSRTIGEPVLVCKEHIEDQGIDAAVAS